MFEIGDFYQGGVIFYIFKSVDVGYYVSGQVHGLIVTVVDQSTSIIQWYNGSYITTGATATAVGTGRTNTDTIIAIQGPTATTYAAGLARAYRGGGYDDWYLPAKDELHQMSLNRSAINTTAALNGGSDLSTSGFVFWYWSSTEFDGNKAWSQSFTNGHQYGLNKNTTRNAIVRAVRAF